MDQKILDLVRDDPRYPYEAYDFVCDAVSFTQEALGRVPDEDDDPDTDYHVSGPELARGVCGTSTRASPPSGQSRTSSPSPST